MRVLVALLAVTTSGAGGCLIGSVARSALDRPICDSDQLHVEVISFPLVRVAVFGRHQHERVGISGDIHYEMSPNAPQLHPEEPVVRVNFGCCTSETGPSTKRGVAERAGAASRISGGRGGGYSV